MALRPLSLLSSVLVLSGLVLPGSGCVAVKSWERGTLGHPCMQMTPRLGDDFRAHMTPIREGAAGGVGQIGGGCGCN